VKVEERLVAERLPVESAEEDRLGRIALVEGVIRTCAKVIAISEEMLNKPFDVRMPPGQCRPETSRVAIFGDEAIRASIARERETMAEWQDELDELNAQGLAAKG